MVASLIFVTSFFVLLSGVLSSASPQTGAFERLKELEGTWTWTVNDRQPPTEMVATYRITGGDRVIIEDMGGMTTAYHLDGDKLLLTHFCWAGNQPRMRMTTADDRRISFEMYDITNLNDPNTYHSTALDVVFLSKDRVDLTYTGKSKGEAQTTVFHLTRKK